MPSVSIGLKVGGAEQGMANAILDAFAAQLTQAIQRAVPAIRDAVSAVVRTAILDSSTVASLLTGELLHELGVVDASATVRWVAEAVASGISVENLGVRRQGSGLAGGLRLSILKSDLSEVLPAPGGSFISEKARAEVPWLKWLTTAGDATMITEYHYWPAASPRSRTGRGIMEKGGSWKVPPEFSGTPEDNWVTRAVLDKVADIQLATQAEIEKALRA